MTNRTDGDGDRDDLTSRIAALDARSGADCVGAGRPMFRALAIWGVVGVALWLVLVVAARG